MKFFSGLILIVLIACATFSNWLMIASFNFNQNYIAKTLCVNRNNPCNNCNGHCYLSNQINKQEKNSASSNTGKEKFEIQLFLVEKSISINNEALLKVPTQEKNQCFVFQQCEIKIDHPPSC